MLDVHAVADKEDHVLGSGFFGGLHHHVVYLCVVDDLRACVDVAGGLFEQFRSGASGIDAHQLVGMTAGTIGHFTVGIALAVLCRQVADAKLFLRAEVAVRVIARDDDERVFPTDAVRSAFDERFGRLDRFFEVVDAAYHVLVVVGVVAPVDISLLDHDEEAVLVLVQHRERCVGHFGKRRVFVHRRRAVARAARNGCRSGRIGHFVVFEVAA